MLSSDYFNSNKKDLKAKKIAVFRTGILNRKLFTYQNLSKIIKYKGIEDAL